MLRAPHPGRAPGRGPRRGDGERRPGARHLGGRAPTGRSRSADARAHFGGYAEEYKRFRPDYPAALFDRLADLAPATRRAWDCATGSGQAALGLASRFDSVIATDISLSQLARAPAHDRVRYAAAAAEAAPLPDRSVELVTVAQAVHWFDFARFFAEVGRVSRPGGVLAIWSYHDFRASPAVDEVSRRLYGEILRPYWLPRRRHVENGYAGVPVPFEPIGVATEKLEKSWSLEELLGYLHTWSAARIYEREHGIDPVTLVEDDLRAAWGGHDRPSSVAWTLTLRTFSVR